MTTVRIDPLTPRYGQDEVDAYVTTLQGAAAGFSCVVTVVTDAPEAEYTVALTPQEWSRFHGWLDTVGFVPGSTDDIAHVLGRIREAINDAPPSG